MLLDAGERELSKQFLSRLSWVLTYVVLSLSAVVFLFPVVWTVLTSIKRPALAFADPPVFLFTPTLQSYRDLVTGRVIVINIWRNALNSVVVSTASTLISLVVAALAAYSLSRFRFRFRGSISFTIIAVRMLPPIGMIIPLYLLMNSLDLLDTRPALILSYTALNVPFATWMLRGFIDDIPISLEEAAMIDGSSRSQVLWRIVMPLILPGLAATAVFTFLLPWNDFALALILTNKVAPTLPLLIMSFLTSEGVLWGPIAAVTTLTIIPPIMFVLFAQKFLIRGLTFGAVKG